MGAFLAAVVTSACLLATKAPCAWDLSYEDGGRVHGLAMHDHESEVGQRVEMLRRALVAAPKRARLLEKASRDVGTAERLLVEAQSQRGDAYVGVLAVRDHAVIRVRVLKDGDIFERDLNEEAWESLHSILAEGDLAGYVDGDVLDSSLIVLSVDVRGRCEQLAYMGLLVKGEPGRPSGARQAAVERTHRLIREMLSLAK